MTGRPTRLYKIARLLRASDLVIGLLVPLGLGLCRIPVVFGSDAVTKNEKKMNSTRDNCARINFLFRLKLFTGEIKSVDGTSYDLRTSKNLGKAIEGLREGGFDFNYCLDKADSSCKDVTLAAR